MNPPSEGERRPVRQRVSQSGWGGVLAIIGLLVGILLLAMIVLAGLGMLSN